MQVKGKLKHFIWKCYHNILPIRQQLMRKGCSVDQHCPLCGEEEENLKHLFFKCGRAQLVLKLTLVKWDGLDKEAVKFEWWWQKLCALSMDKINQDRIQLSVYILWLLWKTRNMWIFNGERRTEKEIVDLAIAEWQEFTEVTVANPFIGCRSQKVCCPK